MHPAITEISGRRIAATVITIGLHLVLLLAVLRPTTYSGDRSVITRNEVATLELRLIQSPQTVPIPPPSPAIATLSKPDTKSQQPVHQVARDLLPDSRSNANVATSPATPVIPLVALPSKESSATIGPYRNNSVPTGDGGLRERLRNTRRSGAIHGIPGSDRRIVPGIQLTDPLNQGLGAAMRKTQRVFGITNRHCVDVEIWQHLAPDELRARHLTTADVERERDKYDCDRPLGLSF